MDQKPMPCGSTISCNDCTNYYMSNCTHIDRMTEKEYEKHKEILRKNI